MHHHLARVGSAGSAAPLSKVDTYLRHITPPCLFGGTLYCHEERRVGHAPRATRHAARDEQTRRALTEGC